MVSELFLIFGDVLLRLIVVPIGAIFSRTNDRDAVANALGSDSAALVHEIVVLESRWTPQGLRVRFRNVSDLEVASVCFQVKASRQGCSCGEFEERSWGTIPPGEKGECVLGLTHATTESYPLDFRNCSFQVAALYGAPA